MDINTLGQNRHCISIFIDIVPGFHKQVKGRIKNHMGTDKHGDKKCQPFAFTG